MGDFAKHTEISMFGSDDQYAACRCRLFKGHRLTSEDMEGLTAYHRKALWALMD